MSISLATRGMIAEAGEAVSPGWTGDEKKQIRDALGVDGDKVKSVGGVSQRVKSNVDAILAMVS